PKSLIRPADASPRPGAFLRRCAVGCRRPQRRLRLRRRPARNDQTLRSTCGGVSGKLAISDMRALGQRSCVSAVGRFTTSTDRLPMAANLTPQYLKAEEAYRRAATTEEEIQWLEVML